MPGSQVEAARQALLEILRDQTGAGEALEGVSIFQTGLWKEHKSRDRLTVLDAEEHGIEWAALGRLQGDETFTIPVGIEVIRPAANLTAAEARRSELVAAVVVAVGTDTPVFTLRGTVRRVLPAGTRFTEGGPLDDTTVVARTRLLLFCEARISFT